MNGYEDDEDWCVYDDIPCDHNCPGCEYNWKDSRYKEVEDEQERQG